MRLLPYTGSYLTLGDDSVSKGFEHGVDDRGSIIVKGRHFSCRQTVQTGSEAHSVSYPMDTAESVFEGKAVGAWIHPLTAI
jgi:hypothetical protein